MKTAGHIHGVKLLALTARTDHRQTFIEVFKSNKIRQINSCVMNIGVEKLRHFHIKQTDWWWVASGALFLQLYDLRKESPTFGESEEVVLTREDNCVVQIPPMVAHGCTVLEPECHLIYATDQFYDPSDEYRIP